MCVRIGRYVICFWLREKWKRQFELSKGGNLKRHHFQRLSSTGKKVIVHYILCRITNTSLNTHLRTGIHNGEKKATKGMFTLDFYIYLIKFVCINLIRHYFTFAPMKAWTIS